MAQPNPISLDRMSRAVEKVRQRMLQVAKALEKSNIPYAIAGGNAVAAWVTTVDEAAVRNTRDVDVLVRRADLSAIVQALSLEGFVYRNIAGLDVLLESENSSVRDAVHLVFANELVREHEPASNPDVTDSIQVGEIRFLTLEALVQIKLTAFRDKDRTHLRDLIEIGLVDETWIPKLPLELGTRLQSILDDPNG